MGTGSRSQNRVERAQGVSPAQFQERYAARCVPVILTDLMSEWPAMRKWSLDFFEERFGDRRVGGGSAVAASTMGEGIRKIRASLHNGEVAPYLHQIPIPKQLPELFEDLVPPIVHVTRDRMGSRLMPRAFRYLDGNSELFIGGPGAGFSLLHYDLYHQHVFIAQVLGRKVFRVFSPADSACVYPDPEHPHVSRIPNAFAVEPERFPAFAGASPIDFVLNPGEVVFVPSGWWHTTKMTDVTISVAWNTLDRHCWSGFVDDYRRGVQRAGIRGRLRTAYVRGIHAAFLARGM